MAHEVWRNVVGYEGLYQVSNLGCVKSLERRVPRGNHTQLIHGRILNQLDNSNGYLRVNLSRKNKVKQWFVHRLVAMAFVDNPDGLPVIDHIDGNRHNNVPENLRWCTQGENLHSAYVAGRKHSVFSRPEVREKQMRAVSRRVIRSDGRIFPSVIEASRALGFSNAAVSQMLHGRAATCGGYTFAYLD